MSSFQALLISLPIVCFLVSECHIRECLHEKFQLTPALVNVIRHHGSPNSETITVQVN